MTALFANWRAPSKGEEPCQVCKGAASCGTGVAWFCVAHVDPSWYPPESRARRVEDPGDVL